MNTTPTHPRYIHTVDVAKLVRRHLRAAFPGVKFSVRSDSYAGGSSINVTWTDGPTPEQVDTITNAFRGGRFDSRSDMQYHANAWYCDDHGARVAETYGADLDDANTIGDSRCCSHAELVSPLCDFIHTRRNWSDDYRDALRTTVIRAAGMDADAADTDVLPQRSHHSYHPSDTVYNGMYRESLTTPA